MMHVVNSLVLFSNFGQLESACRTLDRPVGDDEHHSLNHS